jgi:hypothetical protein
VFATVASNKVTIHYDLVWNSTTMPVIDKVAFGLGGNHPGGPFIGFYESPGWPDNPTGTTRTLVMTGTLPGAATNGTFDLMYIEAGANHYTDASVYHGTWTR